MRDYIILALACLPFALMVLAGLLKGHKANKPEEKP